MLASVGMTAAGVGLLVFLYDVVTGARPALSIWLHALGIAGVAVEVMIEQYREEDEGIGSAVAGTCFVFGLYLLAMWFVLAITTPFHAGPWSEVNGVGAFGLVVIVGGIVLGIGLWLASLVLGGLLTVARAVPGVPSPSAPDFAGLAARAREVLSRESDDAAVSLGAPTEPSDSGSESSNGSALSGDSGRTSGLPAAAGLDVISERTEVGPVLRIDGRTFTEGRQTVFAPREPLDVDDAAVADAASAAREWRSLASYDGVLTAHDAGEEPRPWVRTETPPSETIGDDRGVEETVGLLVDVAEAVRNAERYNIRHLGLRPNCVYVDGDDARVGDWGLSRCLREATGEDVTPWAAPEQVSDDFGPVGAHTDVYRLGLLAYYALTGVLPYATDSPETDDALRKTITTEDRIPPSRRGDVPAALDDPIMAAVAPDPEDRPDSASQVRDALREAVT